MRTDRSLTWLVAIVVLAFVAALPMLYPGSYWQTLGLITFLFVSLSVSWNILGGYGGQISFGHGTFLGLGAFTTAAIALRTGIPPWLTIPVAGLIAMLYGLLWGYPTLRLRGPYFSIATIGVGEATRVLMINLDDLLRGIPVLKEVVRFRPLTGGASGLTLPMPADIRSYALAYYYGAFAFMLVALAVSWWIRRSRFGLALLAINMDPDAAETLGISTSRYKVMALMVSAFLVGIVGSLYAQYFLFIDPREMFSFQNSIAMVLMPIIGGVGTLWGPVLGAVVFKVVEDRLSTARLMVGSLSINLVQFNLLLYGLLLVLIILFEPGGVLGLIRRIGRSKLSLRISARFRGWV
ncbi:MAG: branched-chain amino acid ABC transporter permease [Acidobacteria bacterium]|nr:branched-chain amino acid ABC transporter permease [Acidobacteriota bacterium]